MCHDNGEPSKWTVSPLIAPTINCPILMGKLIDGISDPILYIKMTHILYDISKTYWTGP